jgi:hypothetical protein
MSILDWIPFFTFGWGIGFSVYVVLQIVAALAVRGKYRALVVLPMPFMVGVAVWTVYAYSQDGNLWPIAMIFASPLAAVAVSILWVASVASHRSGSSAPRDA